MKLFGGATGVWVAGERTSQVMKCGGDQSVWGEKRGMLVVL